MQSELYEQIAPKEAKWVLTTLLFGGKLFAELPFLVKLCAEIGLAYEELIELSLFGPDDAACCRISSH